jgi:hypothetical protein
MVTRTHSRDQVVDDLRFEDIAQRNPVEEPQQRLQSRLDQTWLVGLFQHLVTQVEDLSELCAHALLQCFRLGLRHLLGREIENLLRQELEDDHVVFAEREGCT